MELAEEDAQRYAEEWFSRLSPEIRTTFPGALDDFLWASARGEVSAVIRHERESDLNIVAEQCSNGVIPGACLGITHELIAMVWDDQAAHFRCELKYRRARLGHEIQQKQG